MNEWRTGTLGDMLELKRGYDLPAASRRNGKVPVISSSGPSGYHDEARVRGPGVVTGRYGTIGEVFFITEDFWPLNTTLYVVDFKGNDPKFTSYFLRTIEFLAYSDKAAVPGINRNHLHLASVRWPALAEQRAIAGILGCLDDKIELSRRMNETLEAMARVLFKSWFVDFDPVRAKMRGEQPAGMDTAMAALFPSKLVQTEHGEIPEGWVQQPLDAVASFLNGLALQKFPAGDGPSLPVIKIAEMRAGVTAKSDRAATTIPPQYIIDDGDLLFSWSGSLDIVIWAGGRGALNQHLFKVSSPILPSWFLLGGVRQHLATFQAIAASKATTMGHIQRHHLTEARVAVPPHDLLSHAGRALAPLQERIAANSRETKTLTAVRDTLLPCLLSGELRVFDRGRAAEAA